MYVKGKKVDFFHKISNRNVINTEDQREQIDLFIKCFVKPYEGMSYSAQAYDIKFITENFLGFDIGNKTFLEIMHSNNLSIKKHGKGLGIYNIKSDFLTSMTILNKSIKNKAFFIKIYSK